MSDKDLYGPARDPNDLARLFIERGNAGDIEGLVALFEPDALVSGIDGGSVSGHAEIQKKYRRLLAAEPRFSLGLQHPPMISGDLALTSMSFPDGGAAAEVARRQPDGTWLWIIDKGNIGPSFS